MSISTNALIIIIVLLLLLLALSVAVLYLNHRLSRALTRAEAKNRRAKNRAVFKGNHAASCKRRERRRRGQELPHEAAQEAEWLRGLVKQQAAHAAHYKKDAGLLFAVIQQRGFVVEGEFPAIFEAALRAGKWKYDTFPVRRLPSRQIVYELLFDDDKTFSQRWMAGDDLTISAVPDEESASPPNWLGDGVRNLLKVKR